MKKHINLVLPRRVPGQPPITEGRRRFLKQASIGALAGLILSESFTKSLAHSYHPSRVIRVHGSVQVGARGLAGVSITDGLTVVQTDAEGQFELTSSTAQRFVYLSVPAGYKIRQNPVGTARFYEPIRIANSGEMEINFELEPLQASDENHTFFVLADPQTANAADVALFHRDFVPDFTQVVKTYAGATMFGVGCGDIMWDNLDLYPEYERGIQPSGIPFFQVVGNHDIDFEVRSDEHTTQVFEQHFGPTYYSFDRGAVHYVVLDDIFWHGQGYIGYLHEQQLTWLEQDLAFVEAGRPVVVFLHIPGLSTQYRRNHAGSPSISTSVTNREVLYRMLEPYQAHLISGHTHEKEHVFEGGVHEHVAGAVCGGWWTGPICIDGTPNGYDVFDVRGEHISWRYKATGRDFDHQMRLYRQGSDPAAPDEIIANIWDWEPEWTVHWYVDGERRGPMSRRTGRDPYAVELLEGEALPERRGWVNPNLTGHLFYAPAPDAAREIRVEATDREGRTYTETLT